MISQKQIEHRSVANLAVFLKAEEESILKRRRLIKKRLIASRKLCVSRTPVWSVTNWIPAPASVRI